ncbi:arylsulfatase, partial [bacterium]|nr:arylsulfatase [bacterium]
FPHAYRSLAGKPGGKGGIPAAYSQGKTGLALFDLEAYIGQQTNVAAKHPDVVKRLQALADTMRADLGDSGTKIRGNGARQPGQLRS